MRNANRWSGAIVGWVVLAGASHVLGQDWPGWRGANRDGKVTGFAAPPSAALGDWSPNKHMQPSARRARRG